MMNARAGADESAEVPAAPNSAMAIAPSVLFLPSIVLHGFRSSRCGRASDSGLLLKREMS
jgi:hypothetical protein